MAKRSNFTRRERDYYPTPAQAIPSLISHLEEHFPAGLQFAEPCAGNGQLINFLEKHHGLKCTFACDIEPRRIDIEKYDALEIEEQQIYSVDMVVTNPPWDRNFLHDFIHHCVVNLGKPTWLLFDSDWIHTLQARKTGLLEYLDSIVSVGRLKWIEGSKHSSKDNCSWHFFDKGSKGRPTKFYGRLINDS